MSSPAAAAAEDRPRRKLYTQLWFWVLIAIAAGILFGLVAPDTAEKAKWLADAFIQVIQAITGPVIFVTVVIGIASIGSLAKAGGLAAKALIYFFTMTVDRARRSACIVGNLVAPGSGFERHAGRRGARVRAEEEIGEAGRAGPRPVHHRQRAAGSFVQPFVENEILRILVLGIITAAAISFLADARAQEGRRRLRGGRPDHLRRHPHRHVGSRRSARSAAWPTRSRCSARRR